jgi:hypothetical protein
MFITPCFIRKNTPELRKKLEELGYFPSSKIWYDENFAICTIYRDNAGEYFTFKIDDDFERIIAPSYPYIDCGTNEDLFFALAALRDDTNENQWFIAQDTMWDENYNGEITVYYEENEWLMWDYYSFMEDMPSDFKKATVEEIIEHFKKE